MAIKYRLPSGPDDYHHDVLTLHASNICPLGSLQDGSKTAKEAPRPPKAAQDRPKNGQERPKSEHVDFDWFFIGLTMIFKKNGSRE